MPNRRSKNGIKSVLELAKWSIGDKPYWIILRAINNGDVLDSGNEWAFTDYVHPKVFYTRNILKNVWDKRKKLPMLHASDFSFVIELLTSEFFVETFEISAIQRCHNTGEFIYTNIAGESMPESYLFDSAVDAQKERDRVKSMISKWSQNTQIEDQT